MFFSGPFICHICKKEFLLEDCDDNLYTCLNNHFVCKEHLQDLYDEHGEDIILREIKATNNWLPTHYCPVCLESKLKDNYIDSDYLLQYLLWRNSTNEDDIRKEINEKFDNLEEFYQFIGKYGE